MRSIQTLSISLLLGMGLLLSTAWADEGMASLEELLAEADRHNPELLAARDRAEMQGYKVDQATSLADPQLAFGLINYPIDELKSDVTPMTGNSLKLSQKFPFPGKLAAKGDMARQRTLWYEKVYADARLQLRQRVKDAWHRLLFQRQAAELTRKNIRILDDFIRLTETRYQVGKGLQQNVLKAQVERSKLFDKLLTLEQREETVLAELNSLVGRETGEPLVEQPIPELSRPGYALADLQRQAELLRPMFGAYRSLIDQFEAKRRLAKLEYRPDFNLWAGYRWRDDDLPDGGSDFISTGFSMNLPVRLKRREAAVAEADSGLRLAHQRYQDFRSQVQLSVHRAFARMEQAAKLTELYRSGIIPQADQTFQATLAAYQVDKVDFLSLLDALLTLYRYRIDYYRALTDYERSLAQVEAAAGLEARATIPVPAEGEEG